MFEFLPMTPTPEQLAHVRRLLNVPGIAGRVAELRRLVAEAIDADRQGLTWTRTGNRYRDRWIAQQVKQDRAERNAA